MSHFIFLFRATFSLRQAIVFHFISTLLSTDSVYHYILGSLYTLVQFDFHPRKQLPYVTEASLLLRVWGHDVVFLHDGMSISVGHL